MIDNALPETGSGHWLAVMAAGRWQTNERAQLR
jgi:hypothetical protein